MISISHRPWLRSNLVSHFHKSTSASEVLEQYPKLQTANVTHWHRQLKMLRSIPQVPDNVLDKLITPSNLTPYEGKVASEIFKILKPFEEATDRVEGQNIVTGILLILCVRGLREELKDLRIRFNSPIVAALQESKGMSGPLREKWFFENCYHTESTFQAWLGFRWWWTKPSKRSYHP